MASFMDKNENRRVVINVSDDGLRSYMILHVSDEELSPDKRTALIKEVLDALNKAGVTFGIKTKLLGGPIKSGTEYLIAEGIPAVNGSDARVRLYKIATPQPQVIDSGNVNHYELNLINRVKEGEWLGERVDPTPGVPGKNVRGEVIPQMPGQNLPLPYDHISVLEVHQNGMSTLYSKKKGAVYYNGDTIGVYDFLEIKGNVDFSTGNINFNGFLTIKGTVEDSFTVAADNDIEILSEYGVGAADKIISRNGNIYIRGGITGKGKTVIQCRKNLYVKYLSDITVECGGSVYAGFYCMNSNIRAKQVIIDSPRGRIAGGKIDADICVSAAEIGNRGESRTVIHVRGFDRAALQSELNRITERLEEKRKTLTRIKYQIQRRPATLSDEQSRINERLSAECTSLRESIKELEYAGKSISEFLKTPGEGAVMAKKRLYPRVRIEIKDESEEITSETALVTYTYKDGDLIII